ncbi:hypothetical protein MFFC18_16670 [Mariniblastus fucicola]|uniref:Uncharacterized protein n=1 Tax=Mariniblastus fucicola TaxID=980251 RepID=A0A5B9P653_9BACT|nr:hypothetical protein MFFC18_16670 [Mariniblastus fucicola]
MYRVTFYREMLRGEQSRLAFLQPYQKKMGQSKESVPADACVIVHRTSAPDASTSRAVFGKPQWLLNFNRAAGINFALNL